MFEVGYEIFSNCGKLSYALVPRIKNDRTMLYLRFHLTCSMLFSVFSMLVLNFRARFASIAIVHFNDSNKLESSDCTFHFFWLMAYLLIFPTNGTDISFKQYLVSKVD